jgi:hypothetical protein
MAPLRDDFFADLCIMGEYSFTVPSFSPKLRADCVSLPTNVRGAARLARGDGRV